MNHQERQPIEVPASTTQYELAHRLPDLLGTPRQRDWARIIRHQFLVEAGTKWFDEAMCASHPQEIVAAYEALKRSKDARRWIEEVRSHLGQAVRYLVALPNLERERRQKADAEAAEAQRVKEQRKAKAAEGRRVAAEADAFAEQHGLPRMRSPVHSQPQESLGRRCRHQLLNVLSEAELAAILPIIRRMDDPCVWIGALHQDRPLEYMQQQAADRHAERQEVPGRRSA